VLQVQLEIKEQQVFKVAKVLQVRLAQQVLKEWPVQLVLEV
jgi:hypothetical protein